MGLKEIIIKITNKLPYVRFLYKEHLLYKQNSCYPVGHYYSPIVLVDNIKNRELQIWEKDKKDGINGIDLRTVDQIRLIENLTKYYNEIPFTPKKQVKIRYYYENDWYLANDGIILYSMIRHFKPKRIIEIGSGFSSAVMLDTNELFFDKQINLAFIEPYPERLYSLLKENDKKQITIIQSEVQLINLNIFQELQAGDILFVDSSHVVKTGSDVNFILFEILPLLQNGVLIHFHDIFYPFEYPKQWVFQGRNWNEDYILKAFLMYNNKFEIQLFSEYIHRHHKDAFKKMPLVFKNAGGSLWIEKK